jgi:hypothetical protein
LEGEATTMKDVLSHLSTSMDVEENPDASISSLISGYPEFQTPPRKLIIRDDNDRDLDQNSNSSNGESFENDIMLPSLS